MAKNPYNPNNKVIDNKKNNSNSKTNSNKQIFSKSKSKNYKNNSYSKQSKSTLNKWKLELNQYTPNAEQSYEKGIRFIRDDSLGGTKKQRLQYLKDTDTTLDKFWSNQVQIRLDDPDYAHIR